jgi:DNA-binding NarL/FixJ family response regulator
MARCAMTGTRATLPRSFNQPGSQHADQQSFRKVVLIDPREERRAITSLLVERSPLLTVVGSAGTLAEAGTRIRTERADVALVEIQMPVTEGLALVGALREKFPDLWIVVCSFHDDSATREAARAAGADGYLRKPLQIDDLVRIVAVPAPPTLVCG